MLQAAIDLGGTITGEHGVGLAKRAFLARIRKAFGALPAYSSQY